MSLKPMSRRTWTLEDVLLYDHWQEQGGLLFAGVVAEGRGVGWPAEPLPRRIGAVRAAAPGRGRPEPRILDWSVDGLDETWRAVAYAGCEVLVAGRRLTRALLGEALVGAELLRMTLPVGSARPVILCVQPETTLLEACRELGVAVWQPAWAGRSILAEEFDAYALRSTPSPAESARRRVRLEAILEEYRTLRDPALALSEPAAGRGEAAGAPAAARSTEVQGLPPAERAAPADAPAGDPAGPRPGPRPAGAPPLARWRERTRRAAEDAYLLDRWRRAGGLMVGGVALPRGGPLGRWRPSADGGRVGALLALAPGAGTLPDLVPFAQCRPGDLESLLAGGVQVIRAGLAPTRALIGEALAGAALLARAYRPPSVRAALLCDEGNPLLERVCERLGVDVWQA